MRRARTAPRYRLFALPGTTPPKPGLLRVADGDGRAIDVEVWELPIAAFGSFVAADPARRCRIGTVELDDGTLRAGLPLRSASPLAGAEDITRFGGWRALPRRTHRGMTRDPRSP